MLEEINKTYLKNANMPLHNFETWKVKPSRNSIISMMKRRVKHPA